MAVEHAVLTALAEAARRSFRHRRRICEGARQHRRHAVGDAALARPGKIRAAQHHPPRRGCDGRRHCGVVGWFRRTGSTEPVTRVAMQLNPGQELRPQYFGFAIALSRDGSRLAYVGPGSRSGETQLYVRRLDALDATVVPGTAGTTSVEWSPDGRSLLIGVSSGTGLLNSVVSLDGGQVVPLPGARDATWGASGAIYYAPRGGQGIVVRREVGGRLDTLPKVRLDSGYADRPLTIFPDERGLFWVPPLASADDTMPSRINAISFSTGEHADIGAGVFARLLPSGQLLRVAADGGVFVESFDAPRLQATGRATAVARVALGGNSGNRIYPEISVADNGTLMYIAGDATRPVGLAGARWPSPRYDRHRRFHLGHGALARRIARGLFGRHRPGAQCWREPGYLDRGPCHGGAHPVDDRGDQPATKLVGRRQVRALEQARRRGRDRARWNVLPMHLRRNGWWCRARPSAIGWRCALDAGSPHAARRHVR